MINTLRLFFSGGKVENVVDNNKEADIEDVLGGSQNLEAIEGI